MKKLIFVDNESLDRVEEDYFWTRQSLDYHASVQDKYVDKIEIISDLHLLSEEELTKLFFAKDQVIFSYSMYTACHHGSLYQLESLLTEAGERKAKELFYVDVSGEIERGLREILKNESKNAVAILNAIETNFIITLHKEGEVKEWKFKRMRVEFKGYYESYFRFEDVDLNQIIES